MQKAGGIIALIAGIFGIFAAGITLFVGGVAKVAEADSANTVVGLGWGGVLFSFAVIVLGAVAMGAKGKVPGALLMVCSILGAVLGGTLVAIFMVLAFVGGLLATIGTKKPAVAASA
jgi:hypothetical protein